MEPNTWTTFVRVDHKHDQMVYQPYGPFGHTHEPHGQVARFGMGRSSNYLMVSDPVTDALYPKAMAAARFNDIDALKKTLRDANERAARQHYAISLPEPISYSLCQPWLKGYNAPYHSAWMGTGGPSMAGFYLGRYWIGHKLKNSMEH